MPQVKSILHAKKGVRHEAEGVSRKEKEKKIKDESEGMK